MLIRSTAHAAKPGSHHAKFLPLIQETTARANPARIWEKYRQCTEGLKVPTLVDVRGERRCSLEDAKNNGLFDAIELDQLKKVIDQHFADHSLLKGTDGFMYLMDLTQNPPGVYALRIEGVQITEKLWDALRRFDGTSVFELAKKLIMDILCDETPTFSLDPNLLLTGEPLLFEDLKGFLPAEKQDLWLELAGALERVLRGRGYRSSANISTRQEHDLVGSTTSDYYPSQPYKPLGVIHSEMDLLPKDLVPLAVEEARLARELSVFTGVHSTYYGLPNSNKNLQVFLEPLDAKGNTVRDPRPVDATDLGLLLTMHSLEDTIDICTLRNAVKSSNFPYRRD